MRFGKFVSIFGSTLILLVLVTCVTEPGLVVTFTTLQLQGSVTNADSGSAIAGALVEGIMKKYGSDAAVGADPIEVSTLASVETNSLGQYSLTFEVGYSLGVSVYLGVSKDGFEPYEVHVSKSSEVQIINVQLTPAAYSFP